MSTVVSQSLFAGQRLKRDEFLRRWEAMPEVKHAELIGGVVYMPSPVSIDHGSHDSLVTGWLSYYAARTPGCESCSSTTWLMLEDAPQPDGDLRILPEYGGQSRVEGPYGAGAPELAAEVSLSSASYDLGPKMELYRAAGVQEYVAVLLGEARVVWYRLINGKYILVQPGSDGLLRSAVFPGLWLDPAALLARNGARVYDVLDLGLRSPEHRDFVRALAKSQE
jgi:putative restriction endonuclease